MEIEKRNYFKTWLIRAVAIKYAELEQERRRIDNLMRDRVGSYLSGNHIVQIFNSHTKTTMSFAEEGVRKLSEVDTAPELLAFLKRRTLAFTNSWMKSVENWIRSADGLPFDVLHEVQGRPARLIAEVESYFDEVEAEFALKLARTAQTIARQPKTKSAQETCLVAMQELWPKGRPNGLQTVEMHNQISAWCRKHKRTSPSLRTLQTVLKLAKSE